MLDHYLNEWFLIINQGIEIQSRIARAHEVAGYNFKWIILGNNFKVFSHTAKLLSGKERCIVESLFHLLPDCLIPVEYLGLP